MLVQNHWSKSLVPKTSLARTQSPGLREIAVRGQLLCVLMMLAGCGSPTADVSQSPASTDLEIVSTKREVASTDAQRAVDSAWEPIAEEPIADHSFAHDSQGEGTGGAFGDDTFARPSARKSDQPSIVTPQAVSSPVRSPQANVNRRQAKPSAATISHAWSAAPRPSTAISVKESATAKEVEPVVARQTPPAAPEVAEVAAARSFDSSTTAAAEPTASVVERRPVEVEVFYATDRQRVAAIAEGDWWNVIRWSLLLGSLALLTGILGVLYQQAGVKLIAATAAVGCLVLGYGGWIEWQQRTRLRDNGNAWYTHDMKVLPRNSTAVSISLGEEQTSLDYGRCLVSIPPNHQKGLVEAPSITRFELTEDRDRHVVLESINRSPANDFFNDLNDRLLAGSDEALIFIHGYNVSFNDAVKRTAQISHDVDFQGAPICYSWPSRGGLEDYTRDMANADWSVIHLQEFLASLFARSEARKIHLIAHSMGNRVLMQALDRLALQQHQPTRFGQIVLAAPDVSANDFRQRYSGVIRNMADHVTLYASSRDRALMVSAGVHGHDRAGLAGNEIVIVDGIDTIDVSHVDTSLIGHSYYGDTPELIDDLAAIILQARPTSSRKWLERIDTAANRVYWKFR